MSIGFALCLAKLDDVFRVEIAGWKSGQPVYWKPQKNTNGDSIELLWVDFPDKLALRDEKDKWIDGKHATIEKGLRPHIIGLYRALEGVTPKKRGGKLDSFQGDQNADAVYIFKVWREQAAALWKDKKKVLQADGLTMQMEELVNEVKSGTPVCSAAREKWEKKRLLEFGKEPVLDTGEHMARRIRWSGAR